MLTLPPSMANSAMTSPASGSLGKIGFSSYWRQLGCLRPTPSGMLVCNQSGGVVWANDELPDETRQSAALLLEEFLDSAPANDEQKVSCVRNDSCHVHAVRVRGGSGNAVGLIGIVLPTNSTAPSRTSNKLEPLLCTIAESVARESELITELDAMASELALRYEELNLFYHVADDDLPEHSECEQTLRDLVSSCGSHLEAVVAAIVLPQQKVVIHHAPEVDSPADMSHSLQLLEREVCPWVTANRRQLVINDSVESLRAAAAPGLQGKLMACPVLNELGSACGIIAVIRLDSCPNFTTGDRRLLEVVATRAEKILQLSFDPLTGLMNRNEFIRALDRSLAAAHSRGSRFCLLVMEIDHLRIVNDAFGYQAGDALLMYVTGGLRARFREDGNVIARVGGAHFAILLPGSSIDDGQIVARTVAKAIASKPFCWRESRRNISVSVGIASMDRHTQRAKSILYAAEIACEVAGGFSTSRISVYDDRDPIFLEKREDMRWVGLIQSALANDHFALYCQAIKPVNGGDSDSFSNEILLRLRGQSGEIYPPGHFMPAAERFYLMPEIDRWVVTKLFRFLNNLPEEIHAGRHLWSINLSGQTLSDDGFLGFVTHELETYGILPEQICFEVTESAAVTNIDRAQQLIRSLRAIGCRFSLDDFGTGLSSFGYLKSLQIDYIKIDGSFVRDVLRDKTSEAVISSIIHLGRELGVQVTAEWVENDAIKEKVERLGVDFVQGSCAGEPLDIGEWLRGCQYHV
jgi:diguanylate cyclase (GGDEF)-like protein